MDRTSCSWCAARCATQDRGLTAATFHQQHSYSTCHGQSLMRAVQERVKSTTTFWTSMHVITDDFGLGGLRNGDPAKPRMSQLATEHLRIRVPSSASFYAWRSSGLYWDSGFRKGCQPQLLAAVVLPFADVRLNSFLTCAVTRRPVVIGRASGVT